MSSFYGSDYGKAFEKISEHVGCYPWEVDDAFHVNTHAAAWSRESIKKTNARLNNFEVAQRNIRVAINAIEHIQL